MLRFIFNLLLIFLVLPIVISTGLAWYILPQLPDIESLQDVRMQVPLRVYSADHSLIAEFGEKRREPMEFGEIPEVLIDAILAAEDDRFYQHPGVDWRGITRAVIHLLKTGEKTQGGSTITMQVARNFFLSREKTYLRKLNEIFLALKIERDLSKEDILELYLNKIYLGQRAYGIAAAAQVYYGLKIDQLSLPQLAMLAGLPKAPSTTNPISNPEKAINRRNYVLQRMLEEKLIIEQEYQSAIISPMTATLHSPSVDIEAPYVAEMVRRKLIDKYDDTYTSGFSVMTTIKDRNQASANHALRKALIEYDERHGYRAPEHHYEINNEMNEKTWSQMLESFPVLGNLYPALVVSVGEKAISAYLSGTGLIDIEWEGLSWAGKYISENRRRAKPKNAAEILNAGDVIRLRESDTGQWQLSQIPEVEGALVSLDPNNGAIFALVGGFDFLRSKFNRVTQAFRQPGSGFKPFIYSSALEAGLTAATLINDAPVVYDDPGVEDDWRPENYSRKTYGPTRLRVALTHSRNLVSIRLLNEITVPFALKHIAKFSFDTKRLPNNLSLALGSGEVTPWELARGFSVFANGGYLIEPYFIDEIKSEYELIFQATPITVCRNCDATETDSMISGHLMINDDAAFDIEPTNYAPRAVDEQNIWIMNSMTRDVVKHGTGRRALVLKRTDLSGKTGTSNDQHDAWFSGFNANIVTISWVGFDKFLPLGSRETGSRAALPMWIEYMRTALDGMPESIIKQPPGLVYARIDPNSGKLATTDSTDTIFEVFRPDYAPKDITKRKSVDPYNNESNSADIQEIF
jgi:penicillin-binding protein 1A